jgi:hypothetical protein
VPSSLAVSAACCSDPPRSALDMSSSRPRNRPSSSMSVAFAGATWAQDAKSIDTRQLRSAPLRQEFDDQEGLMHTNNLQIRYDSSCNLLGQNDEHAAFRPGTSICVTHPKPHRGNADHRSGKGIRKHLVPPFSGVPNIAMYHLILGPLRRSTEFRQHLCSAREDGIRCVLTSPSTQFTGSDTQLLVRWKADMVLHDCR